MPEGVDSFGIANDWKAVLTANQALPVNSLCKLHGAELSIDTGNAEPVWVRQYPIPEALHARVAERVQLWIDNGWVEPAPEDCRWNLPLLAAKKPSKNGGPDDI